jgi:hypothetical protein
MSKKKKSTTKTPKEVEDNFIIYPPENPLALADVMNDGLLKRIFYENQLSRINNY